MQKRKLSKPKIASGPSTSEDSTLFQVLTFWMYVTNSVRPPKKPIDVQTMADLTGFDPADRDLIKAVTYVNNNLTKYDSIVGEFNNFIGNFTNYTPGECPANPATLKQMASLQPWNF